MTAYSFTIYFIISLILFGLGYFMIEKSICE